MKEKYIVTSEQGFAPTFIHIAEGTGDNLRQEDIDEGYVDYIMYYVFEPVIEDGEFAYKEIDGGMCLCEKLVADMTDEEFIDRALDMVFGEPCPRYTVIEGKEV